MNVTPQSRSKVKGQGCYHNHGTYYEFTMNIKNILRYHTVGKLIIKIDPWKCYLGQDERCHGQIQFYGHDPGFTDFTCSRSWCTLHW